MILKMENRKTQKTTCPNVTLFTINPTRSNIGSNWGCCNDRTATNHMSHATLSEDCPSSNLCIKIQILPHKKRSVPIIKTNMSSSRTYNQSALSESHRQNMLCVKNVNILNVTEDGLHVQGC
jgi:hypothetical protein